MLGGALLGIGCGAAGPLSPEEESGGQPPTEKTSALTAAGEPSAAAPAADPNGVVPSPSAAKEEKKHYTIELTNATISH
jgi:hypothetical protein